MESEGWNVLDPDAKLLWREYEFSKGAYATTMVFRGADGLVVISPGNGTPDRAFDALREHGEVKALVANNSYHHLGQASWRARFPGAVSYAAASALPALKKKLPDIPFEPLSALVLPPSVNAEAIPGFKTGDLFFSVKTAKGSVWYTGDLLTNIQRTPGPPIKWLFTLTDSAPGFRLFKPGVWIFVSDKRAVRSWMLERLTRDPPAVAIPAHGPAAELADLPSAAKAQLERL
jgi:hypothetical protein